MARTERLGADVEIVEPYTTEMGATDLDTLPCIKPRVVRVNGVDVGLLAPDGFKVAASPEADGALAVTLMLLPRTVTFKAE